MMKISLHIALMFIVLSVSANAFDDKKEEKVKDRERVYQADFDTLWKACIQAANETYVVEHSDKESGIFSFDTGKQTRAKRYRIGVTIKTEEGKGTKVTLRLQVIQGPSLWGGGKDKTVAKFWDAVAEKLKKK
jgi:hypothetical protein